MKKNSDLISGNFFDRYYKVVDDTLGGRTKTRAIELNEADETSKTSFIDKNKIEILYKLFVSDDWDKNRNKGSNWIWRNEERTTDEKNKSQEVVLERQIVQGDKDGRWVCQMSTSSGVLSGPLNRRRAIDLVRYNGNNNYSFVELKVESNNPLYAIFEILSYALAYLCAREAKWQGKGKYNIFDAEHIELIILAPVSWYKYKSRSRNNKKFDFKWLADNISIALNELVKTLPLCNKLSFSMKFREFDYNKLEQNDSEKLTKVAEFIRLLWKS